jgi:hypothetical protein
VADQVGIVFSHPHDGRSIGDRVDVDELEARRLVTAGVAVYVTKTDARKAEGDAGAEHTAAAVRRRGRAAAG